MELRLEDVQKYANYGLRRSNYYASVSDGGLARIVALGCEGSTWGRLWGIDLTESGPKGTQTDQRPIGAWLGDHNFLMPDIRYLRGVER